MTQGTLRPSGKSRNSNPTLVSQAGSTSVTLHPAVPGRPDLIETLPLFGISPPIFLHGVSRSKLGGKSLRICRVSLSLTSTSNRRLIGMDPFLESLRFAANCRVHVGRVLDIGSRTSGSE